MGLSSTNLFGRATHNLVLSAELRALQRGRSRTKNRRRHPAFAAAGSIAADSIVLSLAAYYHTSRRAGGGYYDFFPLPEGKWGIFWPT